MIIGKNVYGGKCVYDLPNGINTVEEFNSLVCGYYFNGCTRDELQGQPKLLGLAGPMFNGFGHLKSNGEKVAIIRYEKPMKY